VAAHEGADPDLVFPAVFGYGEAMSTVHEIEAAIQRLSTEEMRQVHEWLANVLEDQLEHSEEFKARIDRSEREMAEGKKPRLRQP
jgi:predicted outer membrane protein